MPDVVDFPLTAVDHCLLTLVFFSVRFPEQKMMSDASEMLAAALEQMDGIIAGSHTVHLARRSMGSEPHLETLRLAGRRRAYVEWTLAQRVLLLPLLPALKSNLSQFPWA